MPVVTETSLPWRNAQADKLPWDHVFDMARKVGAWPTLGYTVAETNYEYIAAAG